MLQTILSLLSGAIVELVALLGLVVAAFGWARATKQRDAAEEDAAEARNVVHHLREREEIQNEVEALNDRDLGDAARRWLQRGGSPRD